MSPSTRLDIELEFSLAEPDRTSADPSGEASPTADTMSGTITAQGLEIEVYSSNPALFVQSGTTKLKEIRGIAAALAERGLTVSLSGPDGLIAKLGAVRPSVTQRLLTGSPHIGLGSRNALAPLLKRRNAKTATTPAMVLPPGTLFPLIPTFDRQIRRRITTTHYAPGGGRPRLFFIVGSETWNGQMPREFELKADVTTIGSSTDADLQLPGLLPFHAEIRHDAENEYVLHSLGEVGGGARPLRGQDAHERVLRTGARMVMGEWRIGFFREEYADHGRPHGGRIGGEMGHQKPQQGRHSQDRHSQDRSEQ